VGDVLGVVDHFAEHQFDPEALQSTQLAADRVRRPDETRSGRRQHPAFDLARIGVGIEGKDLPERIVERFLLVAAQRNEGLSA